MTNAELERLAILSEECGEVVHIISKIIRHGFRSFHPSNPGKSNRRLLEKELADLMFIIDFMVDCGDISHNGILTQLDKKAENIGKYLHHNNFHHDKTNHTICYWCASNILEAASKAGTEG